MPSHWTTTHRLGFLTPSAGRCTKRPRRRAWRPERLEARRLLTIAGLGVAGDSLSDEYVGGVAEYARSWVELLGEHRAQDVPLGEYRGASEGTWGEPRRRGYEFNWARSGATSDTLLDAGQHAGLAEQITSGAVSHAVLAVGQNDFLPGLGGAYYSIYTGLWNQERIDEHVDGVFDNIRSAVATIDVGDVKLVLSNVVDYGIAPLAQQFFTDASRRQSVTEVIAGLNRRIADLARERHVPLVDMFSAARDLLEQPLVIGGVEIERTGGTEPTNFFVADNVHPHTAAGALLANLFLEALRAGYGESVDPFDEREITSILGLSYQEDTVRFFPADYVRIPVGAPTVTHVNINSTLVDPEDLSSGEQPSSWTVQRSQVESIVVEFSAGVVAGVQDIELLTLGIDAGQQPARRIALSAEQGELSGHELTIRFAPDELPEGVLRLRVLPTVTNLDGIALDGDGDGEPGGVYELNGTAENGLFKFTGDWNGDGGVSIFDFAVFAYWFGRSLDVAPRYVDLNGDDGISILDFPLYAERFGRSLSFGAPLAPARDGATERFGSSDEDLAEAKVDACFALAALDRPTLVDHPARRGRSTRNGNGFAWLAVQSISNDRDSIFTICFRSSFDSAEKRSLGI